MSRLGVCVAADGIVVASLLPRRSSGPGSAPFHARALAVDLEDPQDVRRRPPWPVRAVGAAQPGDVLQGR